MTYLADTNVILRYLLNDEPRQFKEADEFFEKVRTGGIRLVILESVLVECVYVLTKFYKIPKNMVSENLAGILHYKGIGNKDRKDLIEALKLYSEKNIDIVDCILLARSKISGFTLFSFDGKVKKAL